MKKNLTKMSRAELIEAGFAPWDESGLLLIPRRLYKNVPFGTKLLSINGETKIKGKHMIDQDTRGGFLAFGWIVK